MLIDCDTCVVRGPACADCVVPVLLGFPTFGRLGPDGGTDAREGTVDVRSSTASQPIDLDPAEQAAIAVLAGSGLVPPLRLVPGEAGRSAAGTPGTSGAECGKVSRRAAEAG